MRPGQCIAVGFKPRLVLSSKGWLCIGLVKRPGWFSGGPSTVRADGETPFEAWDRWVTISSSIRQGCVVEYAQKRLGGYQPVHRPGSIRPPPKRP